MALHRLPFDKLLRQAVAAGTGKPCGYATVPRDAAGLAIPPPYSVLYPVAGTALSGPPLGDHHADASWSCQLTHVGTGVDQAVWLADRARDVVLGRQAADPQRFAVDLAPPGMSVTSRDMTADEGPTAFGELVNVVEVFTFAVVPA